MAEHDIPTALGEILRKVEESKSRRQQNVDQDVCVIAVSKTKPKSMIIEAYNCGQRDFGENYVSELAAKASDLEVLEMCPDIKWHFIGHLQSNKVNKLIDVPNLHMIQTVDSAKLADSLDRAWARLQKPDPLKVMIQVNASGEANKSGIPPASVSDLAHYIIKRCNHLHLTGLMLIGSPNYDLTLGDNPEFQRLLRIKNTVCHTFHIDPVDLGLSMGMSHDYEHAIEHGSNYVRIGSAIFGARDKKV